MLRYWPYLMLVLCPLPHVFLMRSCMHGDKKQGHCEAREKEQPGEI